MPRHARAHVEPEAAQSSSILEAFAVAHPNATIVELWEELTRVRTAVEPFVRAALPARVAKANLRPLVAPAAPEAPQAPILVHRRRRRRRMVRTALPTTGRTAAPLAYSEMEPLRYVAKAARADVVADLPRILRAVYKYLLRMGKKGATRTQTQAFLRPYKTPWADGPLRQLRLKGLITRTR